MPGKSKIDALSHPSKQHQSTHCTHACIVSIDTPLSLLEGALDSHTHRNGHVDPIRSNRVLTLGKEMGGVLQVL